MRAPRLEACHFSVAGESHSQWTRLAAVLAHTARVHCPDWTVRVRTLAAVNRFNPSASFVANTVKLEAWRDLVCAAADGERLLLIDVDTMIARPLDDIWAHAFDVAYTERTGPHLPLNAGVVFLRVSDATRRFMECWVAENRRMLTDVERQRVWRRRYGGLNQAALGALLESGTLAGLSTLALPCAEWNCEDTSWHLYDPAVTRIVHLKSALRRALFNLSPPTPLLRPLLARWRRAEQEAETA